MFRRLNHGSVTGHAPLCLDTNDPETMEDAFQTRLLRKVPELNERRLGQFRNFVARQIEKVPRVDLSRVSFAEWLASRTYNDQRKSQLQKQYDDLKGGMPSKRAASHIDTFGKSEFYPEQKHMRMINSRSDAFKVYAGPYISAVEDVVYTHFPEFIKHVPVPERPEKVCSLRKDGRKYYATDFTAFESHFVPAVQDCCENALFRHCLKGWRGVHFVCKTNSGTNRMRTRSGCSACVKGRRMSGDLWTSLGNGFTNLMLAKFLCEEQGHALYGFVEGDDGLFSTQATLTKEAYADLGFTIKIDRVADPCEASFCGLIFTKSGEIVRNPFRFLEGFGWTSSFINAGPRIMDELLLAKALSALCETPQCPIVAAMAHYAFEKTKHLNPRFVDDGYHHNVPRRVVPKFEPSAEARELFARLYGIAADQQLVIESAIARGDMDTVGLLMPPHNDVLDYARKYVVIT